MNTIEWLLSSNNNINVDLATEHSLLSLIEIAYNLIAKTWTLESSFKMRCEDCHWDEMNYGNCYGDNIYIVYLRIIRQTQNIMRNRVTLKAMPHRLMLRFAIYLWRARGRIGTCYWRDRAKPKTSDVVVRVVVDRADGSDWPVTIQAGFALPRLVGGG